MITVGGDLNIAIAVPDSLATAIDAVIRRQIGELATIGGNLNVFVASFPDGDERSEAAVREAIREASRQMREFE